MAAARSLWYLCLVHAVGGRPVRPQHVAIYFPVRRLACPWCFYFRCLYPSVLTGGLLCLFWVYRGFCNCQQMKTNVSGQVLGPKIVQHFSKLPKTVPQSAQQITQDWGCVTKAAIDPMFLSRQNEGIKCIADRAEQGPPTLRIGFTVAFPTRNA